MASAHRELVLGARRVGVMVPFAHPDASPLSAAEPDPVRLPAARQRADGGGSSSHGFGYTARALVERRVTSNWFVGAAVDIQQAKDYTPSHALLYVRYSAAGWQGDLDMPPQPLVPYADW
ncbi:cellulose synthase subunit BcsC-related outer membrane protein [Klebsiella pneumoniae]|nr:cellulose synthase subunit BcsC-related outer membrane protein [Klebsiella pneumoniae]